MKKWIKAARLRTLPLSLSGIILGLATAYVQTDYRINFAWIVALCLFTTLVFQVLSNYANDYGDAEKGTDNENRIGPMRSIQSGEITANQMKNAIIACSVIGLCSSVLLIYFSFGSESLGISLLYFALAIGAIAAAIKYTMGSSAYGYRGLGDVFVFIFFGLVSTIGSYYLVVHQIDESILLAANGIGLLSVSVLNMNNMRDYDNDKSMNKKTLVVQMGIERAKIYHCSLLFIAIASFVFFALSMQLPWYAYLFVVLFLPLLQNAYLVIMNRKLKELDKELKRLSLTTFFISIALSIILVLI